MPDTRGMCDLAHRSLVAIRALPDLCLGIVSERLEAFPQSPAPPWRRTATGQQCRCHKALIAQHSGELFPVNESRRTSTPAPREFLKLVSPTSFSQLGKNQGRTDRGGEKFQDAGLF